MWRYLITSIAGRHGFRQRTNPVGQCPHLGRKHRELGLLFSQHVVQLSDRMLLVRNTGLQVNDLVVFHTGDSTAESVILQSPGPGTVYPCRFSDTLPV